MATVPHLVYADSTGEVFDHPRLHMAVWDGYQIREPLPEELVPLPPGSDMYLLPGRLPLGFDNKGHLIELDGEGSEQVIAVSAFVAPAWLRLTHPAFRKLPDAPTLPLFAYGSLGWADGIFWTTALRIDPEPRQDPGTFDLGKVQQGVDRDLRVYPKNRLMMQLRRCALEYGCRAAQNFYLKRFEAPLPTSRQCTARCVGCISKQEGDVRPNQERLNFTPTPQEVAEVTMLHFGRVKTPIASFGQGCEGEPLTQAKVLLESTRLVREKFKGGTINLNTNASLPGAVEALCGAGLSSIRASLASPTPELYDRYHRPEGYQFADVVKSIDLTKRAGKFVSLNLLVFPGLTDRADELERLKLFIREHKVDMIQWRNMNMDPEAYLDVMGRGERGEGLVACVRMLQDEFPALRHGYFNPYLG